MMLDKNALMKRHEEEEHDAEVYRTMAHECPEWEHVLCDIAQEEEEHAHMIEHIMQHM